MPAPNTQQVVQQPLATVTLEQLPYFATTPKHLLVDDVSTYVSPSNLEFLVDYMQDHKTFLDLSSLDNARDLLNSCVFLGLIDLVPVFVERVRHEAGLDKLAAWVPKIGHLLQFDCVRELRSSLCERFDEVYDVIDQKSLSFCDVIFYIGSNDLVVSCEEKVLRFFLSAVNNSDGKVDKFVLQLMDLIKYTFIDSALSVVLEKFSEDNSTDYNNNNRELSCQSARDLVVNSTSDKKSIYLHIIERIQGSEGSYRMGTPRKCFSGIYVLERCLNKITNFNYIRFKFYNPHDCTLKTLTPPTQLLDATYTPPIFFRDRMYSFVYNDVTNETDVTIYDPKLNGWFSGPRLVNPRRKNCNAFILAGKLYVAGGNSVPEEGCHGEDFVPVERLDEEQKEFSLIDLNIPGGYPNLKIMTPSEYTRAVVCRNRANLFVFKYGDTEHLDCFTLEDQGDQLLFRNRSFSRLNAVPNTLLDPSFSLLSVNHKPVFLKTNKVKKCACLEAQKTSKCFGGICGNYERVDCLEMYKVNVTMRSYRPSKVAVTGPSDLRVNSQVARFQNNFVVASRCSDGEYKIAKLGVDHNMGEGFVYEKKTEQKVRKVEDIEVLDFKLVVNHL